VAHLEGRCVVQLAGLLGNGLGDLRAAMAGIDAPEARRAIEDLRPSEAVKCMSFAPTIIRGFCLNWRLAVNGIQNARKSLGVVLSRFDMAGAPPDAWVPDPSVKCHFDVACIRGQSCVAKY
jgi:hypothetical protein